MAMCFVLGFIFGDLASCSAPMLSSKTEHFRVGLMFLRPNKVANSTIKPRIGSASLVAVDSAMYSASVVLKAISVCNRLNHVTGQPPNLMTHPVRDLTELGSWLVSLE